MSLKIRLSRAGAKKRPFYRIVVADSRSPRDGRFIERIGSYNPMLPREHPERVRLNSERVSHWLEVGAHPTDRVARFLQSAELAGERTVPHQTKKPRPKAKALERQQEIEEKRKAANEAAPQAAAEAAAPAEASEGEAPSETSEGDKSEAETSEETKESSS